MALVTPMFLGIDLGTSSVKGVALGLGGETLAEAELPYAVSSPHPGWAEHDAETQWWGAAVEVIRRLLERLRDHAGPAAAGAIRAVGLSSLCPAFVPTDAGGRALRPAILYGIDARAHREMELLRPVIGDATLSASGSPLTTHSFLPKLVWLREHEPDVYRAAARLFTANGYLAWKLTGRHVMDRKTACSAGLLDLATFDWAHRLPQLAGVRSDWFGELVWPTEVVGSVTEAAAAETGLRPGTPVVIGTCDVVAEAVGAAVARPGDLLVVFGSSISFLMLTERLVRDPRLYASVFVGPGTYFTGGSTAAAGILTRWFVDQFGVPPGIAVSPAPEESLEEPLPAPQPRPASPAATATSPEEQLARAFAALARAAAAVPAGSEGLIVLPYWNGARTPIHDPAASGVILGLRSRHTAAHVYRALLESVAYDLRLCVEHLQAVGLPPRRIVCTGGGTRNRTWMQIAADVLGQELTCITKATAARGAAVLAAWGTGGWELHVPVPADAAVERYLAVPSPEHHRRYDEFYRVFRELFTAAQPFMRQVSALND